MGYAAKKRETTKTPAGRSAVSPTQRKSGRRAGAGTSSALVAVSTRALELSAAVGAEASSTLAITARSHAKLLLRCDSPSFSILEPSSELVVEAGQTVQLPVSYSATKPGVQRATLSIIAVAGLGRQEIKSEANVLLVGRAKPASATPRGTDGKAARSAGPSKELGPSDSKQGTEKAVGANAVGAVRDQFQLVFAGLSSGASSALRTLGSPVHAEPSRLRRLLLSAASLAVVGGAGAVSALVSRALAAGLGAVVAKGVGDQAKHAIKRGLTLGSKADAKLGSGSLLRQFDIATTAKLHAAKAHALSLFNHLLAPYLERIDPDLVWKIERALVGINQEIVAIQRRVTLVEWVNFAARSNHGDIAGTSSVDPELVSKQGLLENKQRQFLPAHRGLLEVGVLVDFDRTEDGARVVASEPFGVRLRGVHPDTVADFRKLGTVGDVRVNKVIRAYRKGDTLRPPKPFLTVLVASDGSLAATNHSYRGTYNNPELNVSGAELVAMADPIPMTVLS